MLSNRHLPGVCQVPAASSCTVSGRQTHDDRHRTHAHPQAAPASTADKPAGPRGRRCAGFATASGARITVSEAAQRRAEALLASQPDPAHTDPPAALPAHSLSAEQRHAAGPDHAPDAGTLQPSHPQGPEAVWGGAPAPPAGPQTAGEGRPLLGFATASGRPVAFSEQARRRARAVLGDDMANMQAGADGGASAAWAASGAQIGGPGGSSFPAHPQPAARPRAAQPGSSSLVQAEVRL